MAKYVEVIDRCPVVVFDELENAANDFTDVLAIGFVDHDPVFFGETGLSGEQIREALTILIKRYNIEI